MALNRTLTNQIVLELEISNGCIGGQLVAKPARKTHSCNQIYLLRIIHVIKLSFERMIHVIKLSFKDNLCHQMYLLRITLVIDYLVCEF